MRVAPVLAEILLDVFGADSIILAHELVQIRPLPRTLGDPPLAHFERRINEDVEDIGPGAKNALGSTAYHHALAMTRGLFDDLAAHVDHDICIHQVFIADTAWPFAGAMPDGAYEAAKPRVATLIELLADLGIDPSCLGHFHQELTVQQPPCQAVGQEPRDGTAAAPEFTTYSNDSYCHTFIVRRKCAERIPVM